MKKIGCIFLVVLFLAMNLGMANTPSTVNQNSVPMSSQEMLDTIGGDLLYCGFADGYVFCCLNLWIIQLCAGVPNPIEWM